MNICIFSVRFLIFSVVIVFFCFSFFLEDQITFYNLAKDFSEKELKPYAGKMRKNELKYRKHPVFYLSC